MVERCSRFQCGAPATARVAFDALGCMVWIDRFDADGPLDVGARGAGALCTKHADRLVPPRGWALQDRRGPEPQLWSERPPEAPVARAPTSGPRRPTASVPERQAASVAERQAASVAERQAASVPERQAASVAEREAAAGPVAVLEQPLPFDAPAPPPAVEEDDEIDRLLTTPRSPLLARAFNAAHTRQAG